MHIIRRFCSRIYKQFLPLIGSDEAVHSISKVAIAIEQNSQSLQQYVKIG